MRINSRTKAYIKLIVVSVVIGFICALLGDSLKALTAYCEDHLAEFSSAHWILYILFPVTGLSLIHLLRFYLFKNKENKGIKEIFATLKTRHNELPAYKIPSHYINGFLTVISGGSTGIEVSIVVASATVGIVIQKKAKVHTAFRKELVYAGVAAGIAALFNSPVAGILFSLEVISKKISRNAVVSVLIAAVTAWVVNYLISNKPLFILPITTWNYHAVPFFILLGLFAGTNGAYLTKTVLFFKNWFSGFKKYSSKIFISAAVLSGTLLFIPQLYGDGYHAMATIFSSDAQGAVLSHMFLIVLLSILLLKPIVTSATLAAGGDGGVFAPSLFMGAFLGLLMSLVLNTYFHMNLIPLNFMVIGMAAVLSASLHAPFTSMFLVCGVVGNYILIVPLLIACVVAKYIAKLLYPYTVYTYLPIKFT
jgi:chloride channel protein, CIC family